MNEKETIMKQTTNGSLVIPADCVSRVEFSEDGTAMVVVNQAVGTISRECIKCGYVWVPQKAEPVVCPKCKNPNWKG